jgi:hypothetical protein
MNRFLRLFKLWGFVLPVFAFTMSCQKNGSKEELQVTNAVVNNNPAAVYEGNNCTYSQGYWFAKPNAVWCQDVVFKNLTVTRIQGRSMWPAKNNILKKAFFQASAIQLNTKCVSQNATLPADVQTAYNYISGMLAAAGLSGIVKETVPAGYDANRIKADTGILSAYIELHHCSDDIQQY